MAASEDFEVNFVLRKSDHEGNERFVDWTLFYNNTIISNLVWIRDPGPSPQQALKELLQNFLDMRP